MSRKILIIGLPGAGKTALAAALAPLLRAVRFDAASICKDPAEIPYLSTEEHIDYAHRLGRLCDEVAKAGHCVIADLVCPVPDARMAFGDAFIVYCNTVGQASYPQSHSFVAPFGADYEVRDRKADFHAGKIAERLAAQSGRFDWHKPAAMFIGRFQPFTEVHRVRVLEAIARVGQVCIAVCDTQDVDSKRGIGLMSVRERIEIMMAAHMDRIAIVGLPNIVSINDDQHIVQADLPSARQAFEGSQFLALAAE